MQVTEMDAHITHAVIGGGKAQSFQIAETAEFFRVMSSSLYSDKKLAVVREILCNAWDAHIEAGCTDLPIEITLTDNKMTIRDYGNSIHPDQIVPVYGTYGGSTKVKNDQVTGGFGLGCKAPFAYVDHFEVISFHKGTKTIYNMSLSSAVANGKPGIQTIVSLPTDETGLQVSLNIEPRDKDEFRRLIQKIVGFGEMRAKLNGELLKVLSLSKSKDGFLVLNSEIHRGFYLNIRYGNVVYPVQSHDKFSKNYDIVYGILKNLDGGRGYSVPSLVLQAAPNSVSVTPSREMLEMTDNTINTISNMLQSFIDNFNKVMKEQSVKILKESINSVYLNNKPSEIFTEIYKIPNLKVSVDVGENISNYIDLVKRYILHNYPADKKFREIDHKERIRSLIIAGYDKSGLLRKFQKHQSKGGNKPHWFQKEVLTPIRKGLEKEELLSGDRFFLYPGNIDYRTGTPILQDSTSTKGIKTFHDMFLYFRGLVFVSYNRSSITDRTRGISALDNWHGTQNKSFVYIVPRNAKRVEAAISFFKKRGMTVIDLTKRFDWEPAPEPREYLPKKKAKKGIPLLKSLMNENGYLDVSLAYNDETDRITNPEAYIVLGANYQKSFLEGFDKNQTRSIIRLYGDKIGVVSNSRQGEKYKLSVGAKPFDIWLREKIKAEMMSDKLIEQHYANLGDNPPDMVAIVLDDDQLRKRYKLPDTLPQKQQDIVAIWQAFEAQYISSNDILNEVKIYLKKIKPSSHALNLLNRINNNKLVNVFWLSTMRNAVKGIGTYKGYEDKARKLIIQIIEG